MHAYRGVLAVFGLGLVVMLAVVVAAQTQPAADARRRLAGAGGDR